MQRVVSYPRVMIDAIWRGEGLVRNVLLTVLGSVFIALSAQIEIPLYPVPITCQTFAVLLAGALLGSKRGAASVISYLALGSMGLPLFAGGATGVVRLLGPTGGYLAGFVAAAFMVGFLSERGWDRRWWSTVGAMLIGTVIIYAFGVVWLARFVGWGAVFQTGVLPFIPWDLVKLGLAAVALPFGWRLLGRARG